MDNVIRINKIARIIDALLLQKETIYEILHQLSDEEKKEILSEALSDFEFKIQNDYPNDSVGEFSKHDDGQGPARQYL